MSALPYVRRRGSRHILRIRIPNRLRTGDTGPEIARSLGTSDQQVARRRAALTVAAIQIGFGIMETFQSNNTISTEQLKALLDQLVDTAFDDPESVITHRGAIQEISDPAELQAYFTALTQAFRKRVGASESAAAAAREAAETERQRRERAEVHASATAVSNTQLQTTIASLATAGVGQPVELMEGHDQPVRALLPDFFGVKRFPRKTRLSYEKAFARFIEVVGDKPVSEIGKNDVVTFVMTLEGTASNKGFREPLKATTIRKCLSHIKEFFAVQLGKNRVRFDPTDGVGVTEIGDRKAAHEERRPFTPAEMRALLNAPVFRGCKSPKRIGQPGTYQCRDGRFWYGLVQMFTGCRNGELEALDVTDIVQHQGIWHFDIHKANKTKAGQRLIPIHSVLLKAGVLDWVARRHEESTDGKLFEKRNYGKIWNERILPDAGIKKRGNSIYSLRHNFDDALKEIVQDKTRHRLMGHAGSDMGSRYGNGTVTRAQAEAIERLDLGDHDFSFLFVYASVEEALAVARL